MSARVDVKAIRAKAEEWLPGSMNEEAAALVTVLKLCSRVEALEAALRAIHDITAPNANGDVGAFEREHEAYLVARAALEGS